MKDNTATSYTHFLAINKLRDTKQRRLIFETFMEQEEHQTAEGLYQLLQKKLPQIGQATVYRTLKLLCENGLAFELNLRSTQGPSGGHALSSYFEPMHVSNHHDHLVCTVCGHHFEFHNQELEDLQETIAKEKIFVLTHHTHILYGKCKECQEAE